MVKRILTREKLFIGDNLNGHVGTSRNGFDIIHRGLDFG